MGTDIEYGGFPLKLTGEGRGIEKVSKPKETREFNGEMFILEETVRPDFCFVKGWKSDLKGNIIFRKTARNFNSDMA